MSDMANPVCVGIRKAGSGDPLGTIAKLWVRQAEYAAAVNSGWQRTMGASSKRFVAATSRGRLTATKIDDAFRAMNRDALRFGKTAKLEGLTRDMARDGYAVGKQFIIERDKQIRQRGKLPPPPDSFRVDKAAIDVGFSFTLADKQAIEELGDTGVLWFRDIDGAPYFDKAAQAAIRSDALELLAAGKDSTQVARQLGDKAESLFGVGKFSERGRTYWGGVAEHAATTAGVKGQLTGLVDLGWTRYELINPIDERTTPVCQYMNGKTVLVSAGVAEVEAVAAAGSVDEVKAAKPFATGGSSAAVTGLFGKSAPPPGAGAFTEAQSAKLAEAGFSTPPFHFRCRTFVDIAFEAGDSVPTLGRNEPTTQASPLGKRLPAYGDTGTRAFVRDQYPDVTSKALPSAGKFSAKKLSDAMERVLAGEARTASAAGAATQAQTEVRTQINELLAKHRLNSSDLQRSIPYKHKVPLDRRTDVLGDVALPRATRHTNVEFFGEKQLQREVGGYYTAETGQVSIANDLITETIDAMRSPAGRREWSFDSLHVAVHESLHGYGAPRLGGQAVGGIASKIEEVGTEMATRFVMRDTLAELGVDAAQSSKVMSPGYQMSYKNYIDTTRGALKDAYKSAGVELTEIEAHEELAKAALNYKRLGVENTYTTGKHVRRGFSQSINVPESLSHKAEQIRSEFYDGLSALWDVHSPGG